MERIDFTSPKILVVACLSPGNQQTDPLKKQLSFVTVCFTHCEGFSWSNFMVAHIAGHKGHWW